MRGWNLRLGTCCRHTCNHVRRWDFGSLPRVSYVFGTRKCASGDISIAKISPIKLLLCRSPVGVCRFGVCFAWKQCIVFLTIITLRISCGVLFCFSSKIKKTGWCRKNYGNKRICDLKWRGWCLVAVNGRSTEVLIRSAWMDRHKEGEGSTMRVCDYGGRFVAVGESRSHNRHSRRCDVFGQYSGLRQQNSALSAFICCLRCCGEQ